MALTKAAITVQSSTSNSAGGTTTGTGVDLTGAYGAIITAKITNGATGPATPCTCEIQISNDNTNWKRLAYVSAGVANSASYEWSFQLSKDVMYVRSVFTGNTSQAVTVEALGSKTTAL